jgi:hypothetical protein
VAEEEEEELEEHRPKLGAARIALSYSSANNLHSFLASDLNIIYLINIQLKY